ncbi:MAG: hypothetical protein JWR00_2688 [Rubritepida sp.]|nr:hypothetical protein [Rubritepida sp.]
MTKKPPSSPLTEPVFMTGVGFDFLPLRVVLSVEYPAEYGRSTDPKRCPFSCREHLAAGPRRQVH